MILEVMQRNAGDLTGRIEEATPFGERIVVAFRPGQPWREDRPLDNGIAYVVITMSDGSITQIKGCRTHDSAIEYARTGRAIDRATDLMGQPDSVAELPGAARIWE